jgi:hypothetical protein
MITIEKDAELEKFIKGIVEKFHIGGTYADIKDYGGVTERARVGFLVSQLQEVAAFSAKRAREKAIEECMERVDFAKTKRDPDDSSVFMCDLWTIGIILDDLKKLKS